MQQRQATVVGGFDTQDAAQRAADELRSTGFTDDDLVIAVRERQPTDPHSQRKGRTSSPTGHLAEILGLTGTTTDQAHSFARQFASSKAVVAVQAGRRVEDVVRIFRDFGAEIGGVDADAVTGYDTPVTTEATVAPRDHVEAASVGQLTGRQRTWDELHPIYRAEFERGTNATAQRWEDVEPGYRYGFEMSTYDRYRQQDWSGVEPQFRTGYTTWAQQRGYPHDEGIWDRIKHAVQEAWQRAVSGDEPTSMRPSGSPQVTPSMEDRWVRLHAEPRRVQGVDETFDTRGDEYSTEHRS